MCDDNNSASTVLRRSTPGDKPMSSSAMVWMFGPDGKCRFATKGWLEFRGTTIEHERGDGWKQGLHPDDRVVLLNSFRSAFTSRKVFQAQFRVRQADGSFAWVLGRALPQYLNDGRFLGYSGELTRIQAPPENLAPEHLKHTRETRPTKMLSGSGLRTTRRRAGSVRALRRCLEEIAAPLLVLDGYGKAIFCSPSVDQFITRRTLGSGESAGPAAQVRGAMSNDARGRRAAEAGKDVQAPADSGRKIELPSATVNVDFLGCGFTLFSFDDASSSNPQAPQDHRFIHDLMNMATGIQVIVDLLDDERATREEQRDYVKLLSRSLDHLLLEIEKRKSLLDRAESHRVRRNATCS